MRPAILFLLPLLAPFPLRAGPANPIFATYLGGGGNEVVGSVTTDSQGNIYIAGRTDSKDFPVKSAIQPVSKAFSQIFIAKFSPDGDLLFSTYFGGTANDLATGIAVDPAGNIYVTGALQSHDFPVTNAFQSQSGGQVDAFVLKLDPSFKIIYATYVGGKFNDVGMAITADAQGNAYITGRTESPDFPITPGVFDETIAGYQPGSTSIDGFITKLDPAGQLVYSSFLGGRYGNIGWSIAVDNLGQAHVVGDTSGPDFPAAGNPTLLNGGKYGGGFVAKISTDGSSLIYSNVLGSPGEDSIKSITLDADGNAFITGITANARLPIVGGSQQYLGGDVYLVSADGGKTFTPRRNGLTAVEITAVAFDPNMESLVYAGSLQGIFRSNDFGLTWTPAGLDNYQIRAIAPDPANSGTVYVATDQNLFRSTDAGDTWTSLMDGYPGESRFPSFSAIAVDPAGSGTIYVVAGNNGSGTGIGQPVYRVADDGATWEPIGQGLSTAVQALAVSPADSTLFSGTTRFEWVNQLFGGIDLIPGTVYRRITGNWIDGGLNDDIHALAFNGTTLDAAGTQFYRSTDGGQTWTSTPFPVAATAKQIAVDTANPSTIYVLCGSFPSQLLRSDDGGQSFQVVSKAQLNSIAVNPFDSTLHAGTTGSASAFMVELDPTGALLYSNFLATPQTEIGESIALDAAGNAYVVGSQGLGNFVITSNQTAFIATGDGSYFATLGPSTNATILGTPSHGITVAPDGSIIVVMIATTPDLPVQNAVQPNLNGATDIYLLKFTR